jgi:YesN/AraC family two-component response regulator
VLAARSADAALALIAKQERHDALLVLTDLVMPGTSGAQLADRIEREYPEIRVALMSGYSTDELARSGVGSSLRSLLDKPFTLPDLVRFVEEAFLTEDQAESQSV